MKKFLLSLLAAIIAVGTAMAADQVFTWKYGTSTKVTGTKTKTGVITLPGTIAEAGAATTTSKTVTFNFVADKNCKVQKDGNSPKSIALGGKDNGNYFADLVSLTTTDFKEQLIKGISFTQKFSNANSSNKIIIKIDGTQVYEIAGATTASEVKYVNADGVLCNESITIEYHFPENNSAIIGRFAEPLSITYSDKTGPVDANPKFENIDIVYNPNEPNLKPVVTTPANFLADCANLTYTINKENVIDCKDKDNLTILAPVENATMTATWEANDKYNESSTTFTVTVKKNQKPGLAYSATTATATIGEKYELPTLTNDFNLPVSYASSKPEFAEINEEGGVTLKAAGETVIKATFTGNDLIAGGEASYTLTVNAEKPLEVPTFNLTDGETYPYGTELEINSTAADAVIEYSLDLENFITYTGEPIVLNKAGKWEVYVVVTRGEQTVDATITLNVEKLTYNYTFQEKTYELGTNRYFEAPKLVDADGNVVEGVVYSIVPVENTTLEEVPGSKTEQYFIVGTGDVMVEATIAESDSHKEFSDMTTVTVKEQTAGGTSEFDFTDNQNFDELKDKEFESGKGITLTDLKIAKSNITILFKNISNASLEPRMWSNAKDGIDLRLYVGHSFTLSAPENSTIESIEFIFDSGNANANSFDATSDGINTIGELSTQQNATDARTWTPKGVNTNKVVFVFKNTTRINYINVKYTAEPATTYNLKFDEESYGFEVGDKLPAVNVPEGYKVIYVVNDKTITNPETFVFNEALENAELYAYAFTGKDDKYLPAVAYAIADVKPIILPGHLTIHYSNADGFSMASFATVDEGTENEYVFNDIEVTGYDSADGHYYGHVFFSFYKPAEAAGAPRRAAEEEDWSAVNDLVTYTPAEHLTVAQPGSSDALTLVRNKANTFTGLPNSFRVPSSHETGNAVNFTVKLTENGTPATMTVASGIQTGVESVGVDADGEAEYYTLQGVRVAKPAAGIYLRRCAGTVSKVLVK